MGHVSHSTKNLQKVVGFSLTNTKVTRFYNAEKKIMSEFSKQDFFILQLIDGKGFGFEMSKAFFVSGYLIICLHR